MPLQEERLAKQKQTKMMAVQVHVKSTPLKTRHEIDEWMDVVVRMRDGQGVTRCVGVQGSPDMDVVFLRAELVACLHVMDDVFEAKTVPTSVASIMELRGIFGDEAPSALSFMKAHRDAFEEAMIRLQIDNVHNGVTDVYEVILEGLQAICDHGCEGILVFD